MPYLPIDPRWTLGATMSGDPRQLTAIWQGWHQLSSAQANTALICRAAYRSGSRVVQQVMDTTGKEMTTDDIWNILTPGMSQESAVQVCWRTSWPSSSKPVRSRCTLRWSSTVIPGAKGSAMGELMLCRCHCERAALRSR